MKHKQTLAMLLAAAMVLSMPLGAYADEMKPVQDEQAMMELYGTPDYEAPVLHSISVDKETVKPGETLTFTLNVTDDISGIDYIKIELINETTGKTDRIGDIVTVKFHYQMHWVVIVFIALKLTNMQTSTCLMKSLLGL